MKTPTYSVQARLNSDKERTTLTMSKSDVTIQSMTRLLDDIVRSGWEKDTVHEAWLYEDGELVAYVHERAFQRDMEVVPDQYGDAKYTIEKPHHKSAPKGGARPRQRRAA